MTSQADNTISPLSLLKAEILKRRCSDDISSTGSAIFSNISLRSRSLDMLSQIHDVPLTTGLVEGRVKSITYEVHRLEREFPLAFGQMKS